MNTRLPNCIYIGPGKTGSTWLFEYFQLHPDVYVTPAKDLYFFDQYYERGLDWYRRQFSGAASEKIVAEICHDYIVSELAPGRIDRDLPDVKLMMFLREPIERTFSAYLYRVKHGIYQGSFENALVDRPEVFNSSLYSSYLKKYLLHFESKDILLFDFDDLKRDPQQFAHQISDRLEITHIALPDDLLTAKLKAAKARWLPVAKGMKKAALLARKLGLVNLVAALKSSHLVRHALYKEFTNENKPRPSDATVARLRESARPSVCELDALMGTDFCKRWGY